MSPRKDLHNIASSTLDSRTPLGTAYVQEVTAAMRGIHRLGEYAYPMIWPSQHCNGGCIGGIRYGS